MRRRFMLAALVGAAVTLSGTDALAQNTFRANLVGAQENPTLSTNGRGVLQLLIDDASQTISYFLAYVDLEGVGTTPYVTDGVVLFAHIHFGAPGVNGGVSAFLCGGGGKPDCPTPAGNITGVIGVTDISGPESQGINSDEPTRFEELARAIRSGLAYGNVHTTRWSAGEIRGQLRPTP